MFVLYGLQRLPYCMVRVVGTTRNRRIITPQPISRFLQSTNDVDDTRTPSVTSTQNDECLYLHVGPSGDFWTGPSIFAAKHLQPDYVKSIQLDKSSINVDLLLELLEETDDYEKWGQVMYDQASIPQELLDQVRHGPPRSPRWNSFNGHSFLR